MSAIRLKGTMVTSRAVQPFRLGACSESLASQSSFRFIADWASASHPFIGRGTPIVDDVDNWRRTTGGSLPGGRGVESTFSVHTIARG